ncbi:FAD/NAD(P)-binding protein, partial [Escherichia coli]
KWLAKAEHASGISDHSFFFIERRVYSRYLASLIAPGRGDPADARLRLVRSEAVACHIDADAITVTLADGTAVRGDILVVATGHERRPEQWR